MCDGTFIAQFPVLPSSGCPGGLCRLQGTSAWICPGSGWGGAGRQVGQVVVEEMVTPWPEGGPPPRCPPFPSAVGAGGACSGSPFEAHFVSGPSG